METITEREIINARTRANGFKKVKDNSLLEIPEEGFKITPEQTKKGYDFLMNLWKTPRGIERKNNPFGYREETILENFKEFRLVDWYDDANYYQVEQGYHNYFAVYQVIAKDGSRFDYYYNGQVNIIG